MKTNLAYIDEVLDREVETRHANPVIPEATRSEIHGKAQKCIAGFHLHDEAAERKMLDDLIADRRKKIDGFRTDRTAIRASLAKIDVKPLAVVPAGAWHEICLNASLFLLSPDKDGQVPIPVAAFKDYTRAQIATAEKKDWAGLLTQFFPGGRTASTRGSIMATLVLPQPPEDVAAILVKTQGLKLEVAAVADAIHFKESAPELFDRSKESRGEPGKPFRGYKSYEEWLRKCPIIYTEHGTAAAILAQFGDFPIEKNIVDAAVKADDLIGTKPKPVEELRSGLLGGLDAVYYQQMRDAVAYGIDTDREMRRIAAVRHQEELMRQMAAPPRAIYARDWTGI